MKAKIISFILLSYMLFSVACTDLESRSYHSIVADDFVPGEEAIAALLGSAYTSWRTLTLDWNGTVRAQELGADQDVVPVRPNGWDDGGIYMRMHQHTWTTEEDIPLQCWNRAYEGITACNRVLYQVENELPLDDEAKRAMLAELKVLRASYYYVLVDLFGNVPLVTQFDVPDGYLPDQNTRKEVYDFIIEELTENIPYLSESVSKQYYGRFNKWAGYTLLAKMYLNAEIFSNGNNTEWQKCIDACDEVINSYMYDLENEQRTVFLTDNENSKEIIFALAIDRIYTTNWNTFDFHMYSLHPANQQTYQLTEQPWNGSCAIPQFIDTFDPDDIRLQTNFIQGAQYSYEGEPLYRNWSNSDQPLIYVNEVESVFNSDEAHGFRWGKFEYALGSSNILDNDFPVFRYADVLLMKAEAMLRNGDPDGAAILVTQVRQRNFSGDKASKATVTGAQLQEGSVYDYGRRDTISTTYEGGSDIMYGRMLDELGWEFTQEGRRRQDMIRFGVYTTKSFFSHDADDPSGNDRSRALYPIPQAQRMTNPKLAQNPGYSGAN